MPSLKFIADEGVEKGVVLSLRRQYDVLYIAEKYPQAEDSQVLHLAETEDRILITQDKDFGELVYRLKSIHTGVILYRLHVYYGRQSIFDRNGIRQIPGRALRCFYGYSTE